MPRTLRAAFAIWLALLGAAAAQAPISAFPPGSFSGVSARAPAPAAGYTGTGDVISTGWKVWYGLYAFSAADRGNNLIRLCDATSGGNCADMASDATTGLLVLTTLPGGADCSTSTMASPVCYASVWYDRASGTCTTNCNFTFTNRPKFIASCSGLSANRPCLGAVTGGNAGPTVNATTSQPFSATVVVKSINTGARQCAFGLDAGNIRIGGGATSGTDYMFAGTGVDTNAASDSTFHAFSTLFSGASSKISIDGGSAAKTTGTNGWANSQVVSVFGCSDIPSTDKLFLSEAGTNSTDISANFSALSTAQHTNAGF